MRRILTSYILYQWDNYSRWISRLEDHVRAVQCGAKNGPFTTAATQANSASYPQRDGNRV